MSLSRRRFMTISAGIAVGAAVSPALAADASSEFVPPPTVWRGIALGADAKLILTGLPKTEAARLIVLARAEIHRLEAIFSLYRKDSVLSELNRTKMLQAPPAELLSLLSIASLAHKATGGLFDPTIQPLWKTYADHQGKPPEASIARAMQRVGWQSVRYNNQGVFFDRPGMALTLNGIAQGFISDAIARLFRAEGLENAIVSLGEISAMGHTTTGNAWKVGLATHGDRQPEDTVLLTNQSIATSAPMGTTIGHEASHILHPLTGQPASNTWNRVSVIHKSAAIADALSTGLVLMPEKSLCTVVEALRGVTIIAGPSNGGVVQFSG